MTAQMDWMTSKDRACLGKADLFQASILDYSPTSEEYADLTPAEHAAAAAEKAAVEEAAIDACYGCPFMLQCEEWSVANAVSGVAGGRTEAERNEIRTDRGLDQTPQEPSVCAADRGPRNKVDDATVARLSALGWKSQQIADEMSCTVRSVTRARQRLAKAAQQATAQSSEAAEAKMDALVQDKAAVQAATEAAKATGATFVGFTTGRPVSNIACAAQPATKAPRAGRVSPPMKAIYEALADGQWHDRTSLISVGSLFVTDTEALTWWDRNIAAKSKNPNIGDTPRDKRIADGRRDKVANALSASCRVRKHTMRGGPDGTDNNLFKIAAPSPEMATA